MVVTMGIKTEIGIGIIKLRRGEARKEGGEAVAKKEKGEA